MLTIKKIFDKAVQEKTCKACSIEYDPEQFAYSGYEEEKLIACAQFGIGPFSEKESEIKVHDKIDLKKQKI